MNTAIASVERDTAGTGAALGPAPVTTVKALSKLTASNQPRYSAATTLSSGKRKRQAGIEQRDSRLQQKLTPTRMTDLQEVGYFENVMMITVTFLQLVAGGKEKSGPRVFLRAH